MSAETAFSRILCRSKINLASSYALRHRSHIESGAKPLGRSCARRAARISEVRVEEGSTRAAWHARRDPDVEEDEMKDDGKQATKERPRTAAVDEELLSELVEYLRQNREELREEWVRRITEAELLGVMSDEEIFSEATAVYDN